MAFSKAHRFNPVDYHYSLLCKALSHPARIAIIRTLHEQGQCDVATLLKHMPLRRQTVSQHLMILREMQIINCEQTYPTVQYWLNEDLHATYQTVLALVLHAGSHFDAGHTSELPLVSRTSRASALGI